MAKMPEVLGPEQAYPEYAIKSFEELSEWFHHRVDETLPGIAKGLGVEDADSFVQIRSEGAEELQKELTALWEEASRKHGRLMVSVFDSGVRQGCGRITRNFKSLRIAHEPLIADMGGSSESEVQTEQTSRPRRGFVFAGLATGAVLTVHGVVAAATAMDKDAKGEQHRNWSRTALHTAEALAGAGLSWISIAALRRDGTRRR